MRSRLEEVADPLTLLEGLFIHSPVPYALFGADGHCLLTNPAYRAMFGTEPPPQYNLFEDEVVQRLGGTELLRRAFQGETQRTPVIWYDPKSLRHIEVKDASRVAISCTFFPLADVEGHVRHLAVAYRDVTAEMTIRDIEQERLGLLLKAGGLGHWHLDLRTGRLQASEGCKTNFGLPPEAALMSCEQLYALIHPEDLPVLRQAVEQAISQHEDYAAEYRVLTPRSGLRWIVVRGHVLYSADGTAVEMMGVTVDVTALRKAEEERERLVRELAQERARLQAVLDNIPAGVLFAEAPDGRVILSNAQVEHILCGSRPVSQGLEPYGDWVGFWPDGRRVQAHEWPLSRALQGETVPGEDFLYRCQDGSERWIRMAGAPIWQQGRVTGGVVAFYDVHEQKQAQQRLRALADTSTALAQATTDFSAALEELARLASRTLGECCMLTLLDEAADCLEIVASYHPDPEAWQMLKAHLYGPYRHKEGSAMRVVKEGRPVLVAQVPQERVSAYPAEVQRFVERYGLHSILIVPLRAQGKVIGTLGVSRGRPGHPYTLEDQVFLQEMADRAGLAIQNVRLLKTAQEAVRLRDDFLSVASHELKTPLTPLSIKLQSLARLAESAHAEEFATRLPRDVEIMRRQVRRLSDLIHDLLDVARISGGRLKLELEEVDVAELAREVAARFEPEAERARGRLDVRTEGPLVGRWDRLRLEQVITNLLSNAVKYGAGKPVHMRVEPEGEKARLTVWDEGIGIEPRLLARIFEKFERAVSERHYGGLGLGLYISRQIVEALGGSISVESEINQGARFTVRLPLRGPTGDSP